MPQQVSEVISKAKAIGIVAIVCGRKEASAANAIGDSIARSGRAFGRLTLVQRSHGLPCLRSGPAGAGGFATKPHPSFHARGAYAPYAQQVARANAWSRHAACYRKENRNGDAAPVSSCRTRRAGSTRGSSLTFGKMDSDYRGAAVARPRAIHPFEDNVSGIPR